jgi:hypothetical protein
VELNFTMGLTMKQHSEFGLKARWTMISELVQPENSS